MYLSKFGFVIPKELLDDDEIYKIKNTLIAKPLSDNKYGQNKDFKLYIETANKLYIPKIFGLERYKNFQVTENKNYVGTSINNLKFEGKLLDNQIEPVNILINELQTKGGGILSLQTGQGKTVCCLYALSQLKKKAMIIVNKISLLSQWETEINTFLPNASVGIIQGRKDNIINKDITLCMLQSLSTIDYPNTYFEEIGTTVVDECFPYDTFVLTNHGYIKIGVLYRSFKLDNNVMVMSYNEEKSIFEYNKIYNTIKKYTKILVEIIIENDKILCTPNHKFFTKSGWVEAINVCDDLFVYKNGKMTNEKILYKGYKYTHKQVYDLSIANNHNYIVTNNFYTNNGFIVHNCHNISTSIFSKALMKSSSKYTIGLSATPQRSDGCEYVFKWFLGDVVYKSEKNREGLHPIIYLLKIKSEKYIEYTDKNGNIQFTKMLSNLIDINERNKFIKDIIKELYSKNRRILVLSDRRNHIIEIEKLLKVENIDYGIFVGGMKIAELEKSKKSKVILATYQAFGEGISVKELDTIILTTPKKYTVVNEYKKGNSTKKDSGKFEQIIGRIFRMKHVKKNPYIVDIQDNFSVYKSQNNSRVVFYKENFTNSEYIKLNIDLSNLLNYNNIF